VDSLKSKDLRDQIWDPGPKIYFIAIAFAIEIQLASNIH
jgi:hypothetical protein